MASIIQGATTGLKYLVLTGELDFSDDQTYKIALYTDVADLSPGSTDTVYSTTNEVVGAGYTAGGNDLVVATPGFSFDPVLRQQPSFWHSSQIFSPHLGPVECPSGCRYH